MGKSYIRFKNIENIPFELLGILTTKISVDGWISKYKNQLKR